MRKPGAATVRAVVAATESDRRCTPAARAGRALVTGASGFVGRWLLDALHADGWTITAAGTARPEAAALGDGGRAAEWVVGDVRDAAHLTEAFTAAAVSGDRVLEEHGTCHELAHHFGHALDRVLAS